MRVVALQPQFNIVEPNSASEQASDSDLLAQLDGMVQATSAGQFAADNAPSHHEDPEQQESANEDQRADDEKADAIYEPRSEPPNVAAKSRDHLRLISNVVVEKTDSVEAAKAIDPSLGEFKLFSRMQLEDAVLGKLAAFNEVDANRKVVCMQRYVATRELLENKRRRGQAVNKFC